MTQAAFEQALGDFLRHRGNPLALARQAAREAPGSVRAQLLVVCLLLCSRDLRDFEAAGWVFARVIPLRKTAHEQAHVAAVAAAIDGDYARACRIYDQILTEERTDALALGVAQVFDYYLGNTAAMKARSGIALAGWSPELPHHHAVLSMHAFALEECGDYAQAEETARRALELEPLDVRAHHVVAHVMEMQGRFEDGVRWMGARSAQWTGAGAASTHLWWHLALYHLELQQPARALAIYDRRILQGEGISELIDASALLWRLHLAGAALHQRPSILAARWAPYAEDAHCAFNDLHAMMAFVLAGRRDCAGRLLGAQQRRIARVWGTNHDMTRLVGHPACLALDAYGRGDFTAAEALLRALPPVAHRIGGSHAQRDVLQLTRAAAAARRRRHPALRQAA